MSYEEFKLWVTKNLSFQSFLQSGCEVKELWVYDPPTLPSKLHQTIFWGFDGEKQSRMYVKCVTVEKHRKRLF